MAEALSYELTDDSMVDPHGVVLYRIRATRDIPGAGVRKGDVGGWVSSLELENGAARIADDAWVWDEARISEHAHISANARITENAQVSGRAWVSGAAEIGGSACVSGSALVYGEAKIFDRASVSGSAEISGEAEISGQACVYDFARVLEEAEVTHDARVCDAAYIGGDALVGGHAEIRGFARILTSAHCLVVDPIGPLDACATLTRQEGGVARLDIGRWVGGSLDRLLAEVDNWRVSWPADDAMRELWDAQYVALKQLGSATVALWARGGSST